MRKNQSRRLKAKINWVDADDGTFWISFRDFTLNFGTLYSKSLHFVNAYVCEIL